jgi:hypothetical protein
MKEKCILCNNITEYETNTPISIRMHYIEGCGQVCIKCYNKLYEK